MAVSRTAPSTLDHIERLVDKGSFVSAEGLAATKATEGGEALIDGRQVTVGRAGSLYERALALRRPYVAISSGRGAALRGGPRDLGILDPVAGMSAGPMFRTMLSRSRQVPMVSAIIRHSFGDSSFFSGVCDFVVQLRGTCMALTSPRVLAIGTTEQISFEELGGVDVHWRNGQIDVAADDLETLDAAVRRFLSYLPTAAGEPLPMSDPREPANRATHAGVGSVIEDVCDGGSLFELRGGFAPTVVTALARIGGIPVGVVASNAQVDDGAFTADACLKATRLLCLCDSFGLPVVFLLDSPGPPADDSSATTSLLSRTMMVAQAVHLAQVPKCFVVMRRACGAGLLMTGSARVATDIVIAWPDARVSYFDRSDGSSPTSRLTAESWAPDGLVAPAMTRSRVASHLRAVMGNAPVGRPGPLRSWPVGF